MMPETKTIEQGVATADLTNIDPQTAFAFDGQEVVAGALHAMSELEEATAAHGVSKTALRTAKDVQRNDAFLIDPKLIQVNEGENPRVRYSRSQEDWQDFKDTISKHGVRQAIQVYVKRDEVGTLTYHLAQGFRRMRAVRELLAEKPTQHNLQLVPFEKVDYNREKILADHISLNNGLGLDDSEKTRIVEQLKAWGYKTDDIAAATGLKKAKVLQLAGFAKAASEKLRQLVEAGEISLTDAVKFARKNADVAKQTAKLNDAIEAVSVETAPLTEPAKQKRAPRIGQVLEDLKTVNIERGIASLLDFIDQAAARRPDDISGDKVDLFRAVVDMLRTGKTDAEILETHFTM